MGVRTMDLSSTIKQIFQYHFPRVCEDRLVPEEIRNSTHELGNDDPEFTQKELEVAFRTLSKERHRGWMDYLLDWLNFSTGQINLCFWYFWISAFMMESSRHLGRQQILCFSIKKTRIGRLPVLIILCVFCKPEVRCWTSLWPTGWFSILGHKDPFTQIHLASLRMLVLSRHLTRRTLRRTVEGCHDHDNDCCLVKFEIKGAFNTLWWPSIFDALSRIRCSGNLFKL